MTQQKSGFIGLIGRPNVGKSTLMNQLIGQKISITTNKPQTTRNRIMGIKTVGSAQMVFIDTPGIHQSEKLLNQRIVEYALQTLQESDINVMLVEPIPENKTTLHHEDERIFELLGDRKKDTLLVVNKIDTQSKDSLLNTLATYQTYGPFAEIIPVSALKKENLDRLEEVLIGYLSEGPFYFESDQITDVSERFLVAEFVREALFRNLSQELPYAIAAQVEAFREEKNAVHIDCLIYVERDSQKGIIIGKQGAMLKKIGTEARKRIEYLLGQRVFLALHVKVLKKWSTNARHLNSLGLE